MKTKETLSLEELEKRFIWRQGENGEPVIVGSIINPDLAQAAKVRDKFMAQCGWRLDKSKDA